MSCTFVVLAMFVGSCSTVSSSQNMWNFHLFFLEVPKQLSTHHLVLSVSQLLCFSYPDDILSDITNIFQR